MSKRFKKPEENRNCEFRAVDGQEGAFEGYAARWNDVDSFNSVFKRGAFAKTIKDRKGKIKVLYNHDELIGKVTELREDDKGLFFVAQLTTTVQRAEDTRQFMLDKVIDTMSFGFDPIQQNYRTDGVREITEVRLWEISPVVFAANENTSITNVRSIDFDETMDEEELRRRGWRLIDGLIETLDDIRWQIGADVGAVDAAIAAFHAQYVAWVVDVAATIEETRGTDPDHTLKAAMFEALEGRTLEEVAANTNLTTDELAVMKRGQTLGSAAQQRIKDFSGPVADAEREQRSRDVETLCSELRGGLSSAQHTRINALLSQGKQESTCCTTEPDGEVLTEARGLLGNISEYANESK